MIPLALAAAIPGAIRLGQGIYQRSTLGDKPTRADYTIPMEQRQALAEARTQAGQTNYFQTAKEEARANTARSIEAIKNVGGGIDKLAAISNIGRNLSAQERSLNQANEQMRMSASNQYRSALNRMAGYKDKAWEYNVNLPYKREMNEWQDKRQASMQNIYGGLTDLSMVGMQAMTAGAQPSVGGSLQSSMAGGSSGSFSRPQVNSELRQKVNTQLSVLGY